MKSANERGGLDSRSWRGMRRFVFVTIRDEEEEEEEGDENARDNAASRNISRFEEDSAGSICCTEINSKMHVAHHQYVLLQCNTVY